MLTIAITPIFSSAAGYVKIGGMSERGERIADIADGNAMAGLTGGEASAFEARQKNPLHLAYVGDAVHSLYVRARLGGGCDADCGRLHALSVPHLSAAGQARTLAGLMPGLTREERRIAQRGRNARPASMPRRASAADYHGATAFEALLGYLYLSRSMDRLNELLHRAYAFIDEQGRKKDAGC